MSRIIQNNVAAHHAAQVVRQSGSVARQNVALRQRSGSFFVVPPAPPEAEPTTPPDFTSLGFDVTQRFTLKEARIADDLVQYELLDSEDHVLWTGGGNDPVEGLAKIIVRILLGKDEDDLPDYT